MIKYLCTLVICITIKSIINSTTIAEVEGYRAAMDEAFGEGSCFVVKVSPEGGREFL